MFGSVIEHIPYIRLQNVILGHSTTRGTEYALINTLQILVKAYFRAELFYFVKRIIHKTGKEL